MADREEKSRRALIREGKKRDTSRSTSDSTSTEVKSEDPEDLNEVSSPLHDASLTLSSEKESQPPASNDVELELEDLKENDTKAPGYLGFKLMS